MMPHIDLSGVFSLAPQQFRVRSVPLRQGAGIEIDLSASDPINLYIVDEANLGPLQEFAPFTGVRVTDQMNYTKAWLAPAAGPWFVVVQNPTRNIVTCKLDLYYLPGSV